MAFILQMRTWIQIRFRAEVNSLPRDLKLVSKSQRWVWRRQAFLAQWVMCALCMCAQSAHNGFLNPQRSCDHLPSPQLLIFHLWHLGMATGTLLTHFSPAMGKCLMHEASWVCFSTNYPYCIYASALLSKVRVVWKWGSGFWGSWEGRGSHLTGLQQASWKY